MKKTYTVVIRDLETGWLNTHERLTEREAVHHWLSARLYDNTEPVSVTPEPEWSRWTFDGRNPVQP
jgi:hypothetical protein